MRRVWMTMLAVLLALLLAACSSGGHKAKSSTTTIPTASSTAAPSTSTESSTTTPAGGTSGTAAPSPPPTTSGSGGSSVKITDFTYTGNSPVQCNAPTQVELKWTTSGATAVTMSYDNSVIANYPNGTHDVLLPLDCDGKSHTYTLKATAPNVSATRSITVNTQKS